MENEDQFARKIIQQLQNAPMDSDIAARLAFSRQKALESLKSSRIQHVSSSSLAITDSFLWLKWLSFSLITIFLCFFVISETLDDIPWVENHFSQDHSFDLLPDTDDNPEWNEDISAPSHYE